MTTIAPTDPVLREAWLEESLTQREAAAFLKCEETWLQRGRCDGSGPPFKRLSAKLIVYVRRDLIAYRERHSHTSTSEYRPQRLPEAAEPGSGSPKGLGGGAE